MSFDWRVEVVPTFPLFSACQAAYQESGKLVAGHPNYILLLHKGKELPDEKTLGELGITDGDVLVHIEVGEKQRILSRSPITHALMRTTVSCRPTVARA